MIIERIIKKGIIVGGSLLLLFGIQSCYYDVEEELYGTTDCKVEEVTYGSEVLQILQNRCLSCHDAASNFGGVTLEGYEALKGYVDDGSFLGVIKHEAGYSAMPKNQAQLIQCEIEKIEAWINAGAPNN